MTQFKNHNVELICIHVFSPMLYLYCHVSEYENEYLEKKTKKLPTVGSEHSWKCWQHYLIPPHGLLFSCRLIEKTDSLFSAGQMSFSDRQALFHKQRGAEVLSNSGKFVMLHRVNWQNKKKKCSSRVKWFCIMTSLSGLTALLVNSLQCLSIVKLGTVVSKWLLHD